MDNKIHKGDNNTMSVFFAENEPDIATLLNGMQPNDFRTPKVIETHHGINYYKCNK